MRKGQFTRLATLIIAFVVLFALPMFFEIYYSTIYYIGVILLIPIMIFRIVWESKFDERFYRKWYKAKKRGFWINVIQLGLRWFFLMASVVSISQLFGNGRTPLEIVSALSVGAFIWILLLFFVFSSLLGIVTWYENDKRYYRIHYRKIDD